MLSFCGQFLYLRRSSSLHAFQNTLQGILSEFRTLKSILIQVDNNTMTMLEALTKATSAPAVDSRLGLPFFFGSVGPNPLSVVVINGNFRKSLLNFGEELFFINFTKVSLEDKVLNTNVWQEVIGTYPLLDLSFPILFVRAQPTSFWLESTIFLFRKASLNVTVLYMIAWLT